MTAAVTLIVVIISVVFLGLFNLDQNNYGSGPVEIEVISDKLVYLQGEEVRFSIYVNNEQDWEVPRPYTITYHVEKDSDSIDSITVSIELHQGSIPTFPARSRTQYTPYIWDQKACVDGNRAFVKSGNYTFTVTLSGLVDHDGDNCTFEIRQHSSPCCSMPNFH